MRTRACIFKKSVEAIQGLSNMECRNGVEILKNLKAILQNFKTKLGLVFSTCTVNKTLKRPTLLDSLSVLNLSERP